MNGTDTTTLRDAVRDIVRRSGSIEDSVAAVRELLDDPHARDEAAPDLAKAYAADIVYAARHQLRTLPSEGWLTPERAKAMAESGRRLGLFKDYQVGDKCLGDCSRADLLEAATLDDAKSHGLRRAANFKRAIAEKLKGDKTVSECWKQEDAERLLRKIGGAR